MRAKDAGGKQAGAKAAAGKQVTWEISLGN